MKGAYFSEQFVHTKCYSFRVHLISAHSRHIGILGGWKLKGIIQRWVICSDGMYLCSFSSRAPVLLEKLIVPQLVNKLSVFYGTRRFITSFTKGHFSLS
jgi:hypothetical protein